MASVIVLNFKLCCSASGFCESKTVTMAVVTGALVFEIDLVLPLAFFVAFTLWWRRPGAASHASHLCATGSSRDIETTKMTQPACF